MITGLDYTQINLFLGTLALTQPRILGLCVMLPIFNRNLMPGLLRFSVAAVLGFVLVPMLQPQYAAADLDAIGLLVLIVKEAFIGMALGFMFAIPFWVFEAIGFVIDNQRGASIGVTLNPATGNDTSPLGVLFNQAFIVFFMVGGGFTLMLSVLYDSFRLWDIWSYYPQLTVAHAPLMLDQLSRMMRLVLLFAAPAIIAMFLAELGLGLANRFTPQLQVFFLALPIKSALALLVLVFYTSILFDDVREVVAQLGDILPFLDRQWGTP